MSKNLLEELLIQAGTLNEETEKRVNKNQKVVIENTMASAVRNFIQEAVGEEDLEGTEEDLEGTEDIEVYTEEEVDAETGEALDSEEEDYSDEEDEDYEDTEEEDYSDEEEEDYSDEEEEDYSDEEEEDYSDEEEEDYSDEEEEDYSDEEEDMYGSEYTADEDEEEVMDMTNAEINDVMKFIEDSDEDVVIQVVKHPTYDVKVSGGSKRMPKGMESSMEDEEDVELEIDETVLMEMMKELKSEMKGMKPMKEMKGMRKEEIKDIYEDESEDFSGDITLEIEDLDEEMSLDEMNLSPVGPTRMKDDSGKEFEVKSIEENRRLKNQLNKLIAENKKLKINETKSIAALKSMIEQTKQVALVNSNLAYVSRLFTEHSTTKQEKVAILKQFDSAKTLKESEMTYKILTESLVKRTQKKTLNVNINEAVDFNKQKVVKEEKAYVNDPEQEKILRLMDYKSNL
jgi:hypothetical protein